MRQTPKRIRKPLLIMVPVRAFAVTFIVTLLSFAVSLLLGIIGLELYARIRGIHPNMALAYRDVAAPVAIVVGAIVLVMSLTMEIRHYRQSKTLAGIERAG